MYSCGVGMPGQRGGRRCTGVRGTQPAQETTLMVNVDKKCVPCCGSPQMEMYRHAPGGVTHPTRGTVICLSPSCGPCSREGLGTDDFVWLLARSVHDPWSGVCKSYFTAIARHDITLHPCAYLTYPDGQGLKQVVTHLGVWCTNWTETNMCDPYSQWRQPC